MQIKKTEISVGLFMLVTLCAVVFLCLKVADINALGKEPTYRLYASFDNIGGLKVNSPVKIGGVLVGRVAGITLDSKRYEPRVALDIQKRYDNLPNTSSLAIRTSGLLGEQYLALSVGFDDPEMGTRILKENDVIEDTKPAMVLEDLIGQFLYKSSSETPSESGDESATH